MLGEKMKEENGSTTTIGQLALWSSEGVAALNMNVIQKSQPDYTKERAGFFQVVLHTDIHII